jgi:hypothetical protein
MVGHGLTPEEAKRCSPSCHWCAAKILRERTRANGQTPHDAVTQVTHSDYAALEIINAS